MNGRLYGNAIQAIQLLFLLEQARTTEISLLSGPFFSFRRMAVLTRLNVTYRYTCHLFSTWHPPSLPQPSPIPYIQAPVFSVSPVFGRDSSFPSHRPPSHQIPPPSTSTSTSTSISISIIGLFLTSAGSSHCSTLPISLHRSICSPYSLISLRPLR